MLAEIEQLLVLQDRDQRIRALKNELRHAPIERKGLETRLAAAREGAASTKQRLRELEVRKKTLQGEAEAKREQIGRFKTQQMQTRKNDEYQGFTTQIAHFEKLIVDLEDQELEVMEAIEAMGPEVAAAEKQAAEAEAAVAQQIANLEAKITSVEGQLQQLEAGRPALTEPLDEDLLNIYQRLFATKEGQAVVALENEVCQGCHMKLTTQTALKVKAALEVTHCEQCARILYEAR
ncbi:MAG TPA: C4-type zinc ribbon domain-containing protein [Chthoniobacteraceae bacterium]|nr:C4-type zinc ribbon domain-containing protein [Chthoniobacteraceae bacterium]